MPQYTFAFTGQVTGSGPDRETARGSLRACLDNTLQQLDDTCPSADITTSPVTLLGRGELVNRLIIICGEADVALRGAALSRTTSLRRIRDNAEQLLEALGVKTGADEAPPPATTGAVDKTADRDLLKNLDAALARANDLHDDPHATPAQQAQIRNWVARAADAARNKDTDEIRRILKTPFVTSGGAS